MDNSGLPEALLSDTSTPDGFFTRSSIRGTIDSPTLDTSAPDIPITAYNLPPNAAQPGGAATIITNDARLSSNVVLQNGSLWGVQNVASNGLSALRFFQIDAATNKVLQDRLITDPNLYFYYGSLAVNDAGDVVIGFSGSGLNQYVSSYAVVGHTLGGVTLFDSPLLLKAGVGTYGLDGTNNRWGDYSATVVDPEDPFTFWTFQEWASKDNAWATQITQLTLTPSPVPEPSSLVVLGSSLVGTLGYLSHRRRSRCS